MRMKINTEGRCSSTCGGKRGKKEKREKGKVGKGKVQVAENRNRLGKNFLQIMRRYN